MNNCFIILAAGESKRFHSKIPKAYHLYNGKSLVAHSIDKAKKCKKFNKIILVINKKHKKFIKKEKIKGIDVIFGGKTRAESSYKALKKISKKNVKKVFIHDAARPNYSLNLIKNLFKGLKTHKSVVPVIKTNDSVKFKNKNQIINLNRDSIYLTQTPQAFDFKELYKLQNNKSLKITDDVNLFISARKKVKFINGEVENKKNHTNFRYKK